MLQHEALCIVSAVSLEVNIAFNSFAICAAKTILCVCRVLHAIACGYILYELLVVGAFSINAHLSSHVVSVHKHTINWNFAFLNSLMLLTTHCEAKITR